MQIVIEISDEDYKDIIENGLCGYSSVRENVSNAIKVGTPLPKNHGRLIDADKLKSMYSINQGNFNTVVGIQKWIDYAPTIIEEVKADVS